MLKKSTMPWASVLLLFMATMSLRRSGTKCYQQSYMSWHQENMSLKWKGPYAPYRRAANQESMVYHTPISHGA